MFSHVGPLAKRAFDGHQDVLKDYDIPAWAWVLLAANLLLFLPVFALTTYTIEKVIPTLAILEDDKPQPPAYEPIAVADDPAAPQNKAPGASAPAALPLVETNSKPVTSSLRATWRAIRGQNGFRAIFRGLACYVVYAFLISAGQSIFGLFLMAPMKLAMMLLLCQFSTAWVHIILTPSSSAHFWKRLPPFRQTLRTTWRPTVILWAAGLLAHYIPLLLLSGAGQLEGNETVWSAGLCLTLFFSLLFSIVGIVPAFVVLLRVQASLLPEDCETIIPFDRSFDGKALPSELGGQPFLTVGDAWATFSGAAWRRLVVLYIKSIGASLFINFLVFLFFIPQIYVVSSLAKKTNPDDSLEGGQ